MKILLVNKFHYLKGGSEKYYFELAKLLKDKGHEVAFFSMKNEKNIKTGDKEYFVEEIDLNSGSKLKALDVIYSTTNKSKMEEALEEFKPDIVHLNNFQRQLSASIIEPIRKRNIPIVYTAHDMQAICPVSAMLYNGNLCEECIKNGYYSCIKKNCIKNSKLKSLLGVIESKYYRNHKIYQKIDQIIAPSEFIKNQLIKGKLKYNKIDTVHNFVIKQAVNEKCEDQGYAFFFGRLSIEKGIMNLIQATKKCENAKLLIAGEGPEKQNIQEYIQKNNLQDRVKLLGFLNQEQIRKKIAECRMVIIPSIWYENCPYSVLETMEIGKPLIGSRIGGISELIKENENGFLYEYNNIEELSEYMKKLFDDENLAKIQGEKSRELFEKYYTEKIYYNKIMGIYEALIKEKHNV